ncbi:hypothetical protein CHARACLAT_004169 [Characodon lateralis]|uniref:Uncharacterized protein n=1 Tax=Characodon lateralis TaxID=208331 RepID=A0ABU7DQ70_9TELE|nr:hypothetical protein [Characodon lateralis]
MYRNCFGIISIVMDMETEMKKKQERKRGGAKKVKGLCRHLLNDPGPDPEEKRGLPNRNEPANQTCSRKKQYQPPMNFDFNHVNLPPPLNPSMNFPRGPPLNRTQISNTCPSNPKCH